MNTDSASVVSTLPTLEISQVRFSSVSICKIVYSIVPSLVGSSTGKYRFSVWRLMDVRILKFEPVALRSEKKIWNGYILPSTSPIVSRFTAPSTGLWHPPISTTRRLSIYTHTSSSPRNSKYWPGMYWNCAEIFIAKL